MVRSSVSARVCSARVTPGSPPRSIGLRRVVRLRLGGRRGRNSHGDASCRSGIAIGGFAARARARGADDDERGNEDHPGTHDRRAYVPLFLIHSSVSRYVPGHDEPSSRDRHVLVEHAVVGSRRAHGVEPARQRRSGHRGSQAPPRAEHRVARLRSSPPATTVPARRPSPRSVRSSDCSTTARGRSSTGPIADSSSRRSRRPRR